MTGCTQKSLIAALLILLSPLHVGHAQQLQFENFSTKDGLSNNSVRSIFQDRQGFMWFGTDGGLCRFDGYRFKTYHHAPEDSNSISANYIWHISQDSEGFIWIGTGNGLDSFDPVTEKFKRYFHDEQNAASLSSNDVTCVLNDRDGDIWLGTSMGLNKFDRKTGKFAHFLHDPSNPESLSLNFVNCLFEDDHGDLWVGTGSITAEVDGGVNVFDRKTAKFLRHKFETSQYGYSNWITAIDEDASGHIWIGTDAGLQKYDAKTQDFRHFYQASSSSFLSCNNIKCVCVDSRDNLWVGSWGGGLCLVDKISGAFLQYKNDPLDIHSLSNNKVQCLYEDRSGCLWLGTNGGGVNKTNLLGKHFNHYKIDLSRADSQPVYDVNNVRSIFQDSAGKLWLGSEGEVTLLDRSAPVNTWSTIPLIHRATFVNSITQDDAGNVWIATGNGLLKYDPLKKRQKWYVLGAQKSPGQGSFFVYAVLVDRTGFLWLGTQQGLYRFDRQNETFRHFIHEPGRINTLSDNRVFSLLEDHAGMLWVGTVYGLNKFDPMALTFRNDQVDARVLEHLKTNDIRVMCEDMAHNLWIGTAYGLKMYHHATGTFRLYTEKDGLPDNIINGLLPDEHGNIWISTNSGLSGLDPLTNKFTNYDHWDGIQNSTFNSGACFKNPRGEMFFGGNNGLTAFHPDSIKRDLSKPTIVVTDLKIFNETAHLDTSISQIRRLVLSHRQSLFSFEFAALNFINPRKNRFAYKMDGFMDDWIHLGTKHDVTFTGLSPGKYVFRVKGSNSDEAWNETGVSIGVIITPPFWRTGWFTALIFLTVAGLGFLLFRYRINQVRELERLRIQIASDLHDDIGSNLTKIAVFSELIQTTTEKIKVKDTSRKIGDMSREVITTLSDIVWSIDARNDTIGDLIDRMRDFLDAVFPAGSVQIDFQTKGLAFQQKIEQSMRQNIYLIFKEAVNNAAKHARADRIQIYLTNGLISGTDPPGGLKGHFRMEIADNGVGMEQNQEHAGHHGLANMRLRAERIGGDLTIEASAGTRVILITKSLHP